MSYGSFPWISIALALSFGIYGAIKKKGGYPTVEAIAFESMVLTPLAIAVDVALTAIVGHGGFLGDMGSGFGWPTTLLLIGGGAVTASPLVLFALTANSIPQTLVGFLQYISPTIQLLLGVFAFGEPFTFPHIVCFALIWLGLALVAADSCVSARKAKKVRERCAQNLMSDNSHL